MIMGDFPDCLFVRFSDNSQCSKTAYPLSSTFPKVFILFVSALPLNWWTYVPSGFAELSKVYRPAACARHLEIGGTYVVWPGTERHTVSSSGGNRLPNPGWPFCPSLPRSALSSFLCDGYAAHGYFQCCHHRLQLADVPESESEPAGSLLDPAGIPRRPAAFSVRCFRVASCTNGMRRRGDKSPSQRASYFDNARRCSTEWPAAFFGADPGHNEAGHSPPGASRYFRQFIMNHRHLAECQSCRIINGNRKLCRLPAEYTAGTMAADWLCKRSLTGYSPEHQVNGIFDVIFSVAEISHFLPITGDRHTGHIGGPSCASFHPRHAPPGKSSRETLSDNRRTGRGSPPSPGRANNVTLDIHKQTITALFIGANCKLHFTSPCSRRQKSVHFNKPGD